MRNGVCPKCGSETVYMLADGVEIGSSNGVYVLSAKQRRMSSVNSYVCTSCGYMEHYIAEQVVLDEIAQAGRWSRIPRS